MLTSQSQANVRAHALMCYTRMHSTIRERGLRQPTHALPRGPWPRLSTPSNIASDLCYYAHPRCAYVHWPLAHALGQA